MKAFASALAIIGSIAGALAGAADPLTDNLASFMECLGDKVTEYCFMCEVGKIVITPMSSRRLDVEGDDVKLFRCWRREILEHFADGERAVLILADNNNDDYASNSSVSTYEGPVGNGLRYALEREQQQEQERQRLVLTDSSNDNSSNSSLTISDERERPREQPLGNPMAFLSMFMDAQEKLG